MTDTTQNHETDYSLERDNIGIYIDGANLHQRSKTRGGLDYQKFYRRLTDKYHSTEVYMFMGYIKGKESLYPKLVQIGYKLIFKETLNVGGIIKGNCDAELVVKSVSDFYEKNTNKTILVSGDGDFACLIDFFIDKKIKIVICSPDKKSCSYLLKKKNIPIIWLDEIKSKFQ